MQVTLRNRLLVGSILLAILVGGWFAYRPALGGMFLLDDNTNLGALASIDDAGSALHFVLSGSAGPTGRPIALASFLPQADAWASGPASFLAVNILVHLLNACLLASFFYLLGMARGAGRAQALELALAGSALWLFMPLLATSTLMVVQRMTTLSATFVLLGLNGYLLARRLSGQKTYAALVGMSASLVIATLLAVLTKESGALLPVLVLVIETTLLRPPLESHARQWRMWMALFLVVPTVLILGYLVTCVPYSESTILRRGFDGWDRLLTESRILWQYLFSAFVPQPGRFSPFHDSYPVTRSLFAPAALLAVCAWFITAGLALIWRRKHPVLAFAVLWFLAGHLLESTVVPLELYFEHRNYMPIVGPVYALSHVLLDIPQKYRQPARVAACIYILICAAFLFSFTTLWGNPDLSARYWLARDPGSYRAATTLATRQLATEGPVAALGTMRDLIARHPNEGYLAIPALNLSCIIAPDDSHGGEAESVRKLLPSVSFSYTTATMLSDLITTARQDRCAGVDLNVVEGLIRALGTNPRYASDRDYQQLHHQLLARIARERGDIETTLEQLRMAMDGKPDSRLNMMVVTTLVSADRFGDARTFIADATDDAPLHPLKHWLWLRDLEELRSYTDKMEEIADSRREPSIESGPDA